MIYLVDTLFQSLITKIELGFESFWPVSEEESVANLISSYFRWQVHRVPVVANKKIVGHVSQFDVITLMAKNLDHLKGMVLFEMIVDHCHHTD